MLVVIVIYNLFIKINIRLLLLRSLQTAWDCSGPTTMVGFGGVAVSPRPLLLIHGVLEMLGTSLRGPALPKHRQRWRRHVLPSVPGKDGGWAPLS